MNKNNVVNFRDHLRQELKNKQFKKYFYEYGKQLEIAYLIAQKRKQAKISQKELAQKIGTTQSNVARMEAGNQNFSMITLGKIAEALKSELKISFLRK
ncbi:MAG: helix-turn-helix transcriptional regulator [Candidatus Taylorbacteria bacterium]|nr:helix-turn-helix transcriptional regulator [Candidatus Taylorbacteria bacterium]